MKVEDLEVGKTYYRYADNVSTIFEHTLLEIEKTYYVFTKTQNLSKNDVETLLHETRDLALISGFKRFIKTKKDDIVKYRKLIKELENEIENTNTTYGYLKELYPEEFL